jgi:hypothetical protein
MKRIFAVLAILALVLAGCGDKEKNDTNDKTEKTDSTTLQINNQSSKELDQVVFQDILFIKKNADIIGTWTGNDITYGSGYSLRLDIADNGWTAVIQDRVFGALPGQGKWTRNGDSLTFKRDSGRASGTATLSGDILTAHFDIENISGSGYTFAATSKNLQKTIKSGTSITKTIEAGGGYIFFKVNSVDYCTSQIITVENNDKAVFTFNNNTLVVELTKPGETKTLGGL